MKKTITLIFLLLIGIPMLHGQAKSHVDSIYSPSLGRTMPLSVTIPSAYDAQKPIPILYLLHGHSLSHDYWLRRTDIEQYVEEASLICIMPQADNSWYVNAHSAQEDRFEDYLLKDVVEYIQKKYTIDTTRQYIAGFSMGGYGALVLAMRHPDRFVFAASIAGAIMYPRDTENLDTIPKYKFAVPSTDRAFGELPNAHRDEHDPFLIYKNTPPEDLPYIFFFTGMQDFFPEIIVAQRDLADSLGVYGALYEYHEIRGRHDRKTVDASLRLLLQRIKYLGKRGYKSLVTVLSETGTKRITEEAVIKFRWLKEKFSDIYYLDQYEMNGLGYKLMNEERMEEAITVFNLNIEFFPNSTNCFDSISDAYIKTGDHDLAIQFIEKALELLPHDPYISDRGKIRFEENLGKKLKEIRE